jgi:signal transduction histidine kinase
MRRIGSVAKAANGLKLPATTISVADEGGTAAKSSQGMSQQSLSKAPFSPVTLAAGFGLLAVIVGCAAWLSATQAENERWVSHTLQVQSAVVSSFSTLQDAQIGVRGLLIEDDLSTLAPYTTAAPAIPESIDRIAALVADNPDQADRVKQYRDQALKSRDALDAVVKAYQGGDHPKAIALLVESQRQAYMGAARALAADMVNAEQVLLGRRTKMVKTTTFWLDVSIALAALAAIALGLGTYFSVKSANDQLVASNSQLASAYGALQGEIEERGKVEAQLRQSQKMEAIGQLTGGVAHDFNNMLAVIIGNLGLLMRRWRPQEEKAVQYIENALSGARRAETLTHRLLAFSRQQPLVPQVLDCNKLVGGMNDLLQRTIGENIQVETVLGGGNWRTKADPTQLESAILNLAVNARDAMPHGGKLTIETANAFLDESYTRPLDDVPPGQYVLVSVTDNGTGMPPEVLARAFDPFFTTKAVDKGTGLGLSQVYGFVKQSGGHIRVYSELGHGTTIKIYLPRSAEPESTHSPDRPKSGDIPLGTREQVVLVVEDESSMRRFAVDALRELGYSVIHAEGGKDAIAMLSNHARIDLLVTDIIMPEMNGRQLAEEVQRQRPGVKVLYMTGFTRNAVVHNGVVDDGVNLMTKPFSLSDFGERVARLLQPA